MSIPLRKVIFDYKKLSRATNAHKALDKKIVCTIGSWDMLHIGHLRYLEKARSFGDILIVGVDSDRAIRLYKKNPLRPVIPQRERIEMLSYQSFVDYVTLVDDVTKTGRWQMNLLKILTPDSFIATSGESYPEDQLGKIANFCGDLKVIERQAKATSTTEIIERTFKKRLEYILKNNFKP